MRRLQLTPIVFDVEHRGATFRFRQPSALEAVELLGLAQRLPKAIEGSDSPLRAVAVQNAALLAYLWAPDSPVGALDSVPPAPALSGATAEMISAFGEAALAELSEARLGFGDLQVLALQITNRMIGVDQIQEAAKVADFSRPR